MAAVSMGRLLIVFGILMVVTGVAVQMGLPLGRLPGDFTIRRGNTTIYLPLATSLAVSIVLSVVFMLFRR